MTKKVIVAMSGGVDSGVSAYLLKKQGFQVRGLFLRLGAFKSMQFAEKSARKIAKNLKIPLRAIDAGDKFKKCVVDYFIKEYKSGRTPNPCVFCNPQIKFHTLLGELKKAKADFIATGHYAKIHKDKNGAYRLSEGADKTKDQSYFLYRLGQEELKKIIFPLGGYKKSEVRKIAAKLKLPVALGNESQDICFLAGNSFSDFLRSKIKMVPGGIFNEKGELLGKHSGLPLYTLGQRKGIHLGGDGPYYVSKKDLRRDRLIVTNNKSSSSLLSKGIRINDIKWVSGEPSLPCKVQLRTRYQKTKVYGKIFKKAGKYWVEFEKPQWAVTPGQSAVFYQGEEVLGGGIIS